jgi:hypothetical protein
MTDIAAIARGLTKAQRRFVLSSDPKWARCWNAQAVQAVKSKGLGTPITNHIFRLTETGLAVRAYLQENGDD